MTTPSILKSNLREKFGADLLIKTNPTIQETVKSMDKIESSKFKDVLGLAPKYLYASVGLLSSGVVTFLAQLNNLPIAENISGLASPSLLTASATSLALSIGLPMYRNFKHLQAKEDLREAALKSHKLIREDKGWIKYMTIEDFSNLKELTFTDAMKQEYSKILESRTLAGKMKNLSQKWGLSETDNSVEKQSPLVYKR